MGGASFWVPPTRFIVAQIGSWRNSQSVPDRSPLALSSGWLALALLDVTLALALATLALAFMSLALQFTTLDLVPTIHDPGRSLAARGASLLPLAFTSDCRDASRALPGQERRAARATLPSPRSRSQRCLVKSTSSRSCPSTISSLTARVKMQPIVFLLASKMGGSCDPPRRLPYPTWSGRVSSRRPHLELSRLLTAPLSPGRFGRRFS